MPFQLRKYIVLPEHNKIISLDRVDEEEQRLADSHSSSAGIREFRECLRVYHVKNSISDLVLKLVNGGHCVMQSQIPGENTGVRANPIYIYSCQLYGA